VYLQLEHGPRNVVDPEPFARSLQLDHSIQQVGGLPGRQGWEQQQQQQQEGPLAAVVGTRVADAGGAGSADLSGDKMQAKPNVIDQQL
jgi:hypothetical protein